MEKRKITWAIILAVFSEGVFGLSFIFVKSCVDEVSVFTLLSWRYLIAFIGMMACIFLGFFKVDLKGKNIKLLFMLSLFQPVLYFSMETLGIGLTSASESGTILSMLPIITMTFSAVFLKDKPTGKRVIFMMMTVIGGVLIGMQGGGTSGHNPLGYLFLLLAMCSDSAYCIVSQKLHEFNSAEKTFAMITTGTVVFTAFALAEHTLKGTLEEFLTLPFQNTDFLTGILYLGVGCSLMGFFMVNYSISVIGATRRASFVGIAAIVAILGGIVILGEVFTLPQAAGAVLIIAGAYGVNKFAGNREE